MNGLMKFNLDSSEFRNFEAKDRPLCERIKMGKVIHEA